MTFFHADWESTNLSDSDTLRGCFWQNGKEKFTPVEMWLFFFVQRKWFWWVWVQSMWLFPYVDWARTTLTQFPVTLSDSSTPRGCFWQKKIHPSQDGTKFYHRLLLEWGAVWLSWNGGFSLESALVHVPPHHPFCSRHSERKVVLVVLLGALLDIYQKTKEGPKICGHHNQWYITWIWVSVRGL